jgi:hypothetical protein
VLKLVVWAALLGVGFLAWRFLPSLLQKAEPILGIACGSPSQSSAPETSFVIGCAPVAPVVDGEFDDWRSVTSQPVTEVVDERGGVREGLTGSWQLLWDKEALFVHAVVTDAEITPVKTSSPGSFWTGDGISFEFGPDPRALTPRAGLRPEDLHVMIGIVEDGDRGAVAAINPVGKGQFVAGDIAPSIEVARRATADGYDLEARVPWSALGLTIPPARGTVIGMNLNISDAERTGQLKAMLSSNPERVARAQAHPGLWQTVLLWDEG